MPSETGSGSCARGALLLDRRLAERDQPRRPWRGVGHSGARPSGAAGLRGRSPVLPQVLRRRNPRRLRVQLLSRVDPACGRDPVPPSPGRGPRAGLRRIPVDPPRAAGVTARAARSRHAGAAQRAIPHLLGPRRNGRQRIRCAERGRAEVGRPGGDVERPPCRAGTDGLAACDQRAALENEAPGRGSARSAREDRCRDQAGRRASMRTTNANSTPSPSRKIAWWTRSTRPRTRWRR